jgi:outer membrane receptor protein involved in Fe transport
VSAQRVTGDESDSFTGYAPRVANWGLSLSRERFTARMNWNYNGRRRLGPVPAGRSIEPGTFNWSSKRLIVDFSGQYYLTRRITLFANLNNLLDAPVDAEIHGPSTPPHAQFRQRQNFDALWTFGVKGTF